jgi:hypothetical protein
VFSRPSKNGFVIIHLNEYRYRGGPTTLRDRDAFARREVVAILV